MHDEIRTAGYKLVAALHPLATAHPRALLDLCAVHVLTVIKVDLGRASPPLVLHIGRSVDASSV